MSHMSDLDLHLREAGIDPSSVGSLEEATDLLRCAEVSQALAEDCAWCEAPEQGIMHYEQYSETEYEVQWCAHRCKLAMPEHIAAEALGLEDSLS